MRFSSRLRRTSLTALLALCLAPGSLAAGVSLWTSSEIEHSLYVELTRPDLEVNEQGFGTTGGSVEAVYRASARLGIVVRMPFAFADLTEVWRYPDYGCPDSTCHDTVLTSSASSSALGNLYVGIRFRPPGLPALTLELGGHYPTASDAGWAAELTGVAADLTQWEDYRVDGTLDAGARIRPERHGRFTDIWEFRWITDAQDYGVAMDFLGRALFGYRRSPAIVWGGLDARLATSSAWASAVHCQAVLAATADLGDFRPGLHLRVPLGEDLREISTWAIGLSCEIAPWRKR